MRNTLALLMGVGLIWALSNCGSQRKPSASSPAASTSAHARNMDDDMEERLR